MSSTKDLETKSVGSLLWTYALPAVISQVIASVYNLVDRFFLGNCVSEMAIAGLAITMPIMNIIHAFGSLVGVGAMSRMSIVLGRKDERWAEKILGNSVILSVILGVCFLTAGYLFMDELLQLFGASESTIGFAKEYMMIVLPGMFLTTITYNLTGMIRASGYPTKSMFILASGAVMNILLDWLFVYKFQWGIAGAAWATTISMASTSVLAVIHFVRPKSFIRFKRHAWAPKLYIFRNIIMIGLSPFLMNTAASAVVAILNKQLMTYGGMLDVPNGGDLAVGAYGIINTFGSFLCMFILGVCQGMQPIVGYNYGAGRSDRLKSVFLLTMKWNVLLGFVGAAIACLAPAFLLRIFAPNSVDLVQIGIPGMRLLMVMWPLIGFTITCNNFFQSIDKPWIAIVTSLSRQVIFLVPLMLLVPVLFVRSGANGLVGVWTACTISDVLGTVLAAVLLFAQRKVFSSDYVAPVRRPQKEHGPSGDGV